MEKQIVTLEDYDFLRRVASVQDALALSAADPVVLRRISDGGDQEMTVQGGMYYDMCENEARALETMTRRLEVGREDILGQFRFHRRCRDYFLEMDGSIISDDRDSFSAACGELCEDFLGYLQLVERHKKRLEENGFLEYPSCPSMTPFYVLNYHSIANLGFNEAFTYEGAQTGIQEIQERITGFRIRQEKLSYISLPLDVQHGAGLYSDSFRTNLRTNKQLLERLGVELD